MAKNSVIEGAYKGKFLTSNFTGVSIFVSWTKEVYLNKDTVAEYEVIDSDRKTSTSSAVTRGLVGGLALGPLGLAFGFTAKKKGTHLIAIEFKSGERSLIEIDDKIYKRLITSLY